MSLSLEAHTGLLYWFHYLVRGGSDTDWIITYCGCSALMFKCTGRRLETNRIWVESCLFCLPTNTLTENKMWKSFFDGVPRDRFGLDVPGQQNKDAIDPSSCPAALTFPKLDSRFDVPPLPARTSCGQKKEMKQTVFSILSPFQPTFFSIFHFFHTLTHTHTHTRTRTHIRHWECPCITCINTLTLWRFCLHDKSAQPRELLMVKRRILILTIRKRLWKGNRFMSTIQWRVVSLICRMSLNAENMT